MAGRRRRTSAASVHGVSPLRQARLAIPATLEQVCEDLDKQSKEGSSGVTPSMLSGWELGKHITSIRYRKMLADYYAQPPEVLFAHQDQQLTAAAETPRLLVGHHDLREAMIEVVRDARIYLAVVGSRSRDAVYLEAIETVLAQRPELVPLPGAVRPATPPGPQGPPAAPAEDPGPARPQPGPEDPAHWRR